MFQLLREENGQNKKEKFRIVTIRE